jgi:hypothetical protein
MPTAHTDPACGRISTQASPQDCPPCTRSCPEPDDAISSNPVQPPASTLQQLGPHWLPALCGRHSCDIPVPWWEERAQNLLAASCNLDEIMLICKFDLFEDPEASTRGLCRQPDFRLEGFLESLDGDGHISDCRPRKAERIVHILRGQTLRCPVLDAGWLFSAMASPMMDVSTIAEKLDWSFSSFFCGTTYYGWAKWALGYSHDGIISYLDAASTLRNKIFELLRSVARATLERWRSLVAVGI